MQGDLHSLPKLLGGSWVVISGVISRVTILITHIRGLITLLITTLNPKPYNPKDPFKGTLLITPLITTHEPPSNPYKTPQLFILPR